MSGQPTTYADRVEQAANLVKDGYAYAADTVKPYAGETVANAIKTTGEYGAAGVTKTGELVGLKKDHPVQEGVDTVKDSVSGGSSSTQDMLGSAQAKVDDAIGKPSGKTYVDHASDTVDDAIGKPSGKTYVDHASDTAKPYLDEASKQADMAYKDPQGYAKSTYEYATGSGTGTGTSGGSTLDSAKGTAGAYTDKVGKEADAAYKNPEGYAQDTYKSVTGSSTGTGTGGSSGSTYGSAKDTIGSYADKAGKEADEAYKNPSGYADSTYKSVTGSGTGTGTSGGSTYGSAKDTVGSYANTASKEGDKLSSDPGGYAKSTTASADKGLGSGSGKASEQVSGAAGSTKDYTSSAVDDAGSKKTGLMSKLKDKLNIGKD